MTNRHVMVWCAAVMLSLTTVAAHSTPGSATPSQAAAEADARSKQTTVTGCLTRDGAAGNDFVLATMLAAPASGAQGRPASTSGGSHTSAIGTSGAGTLRYMLGGTRGGDLSRYVGQRVEVVGTIDAATATTAGPSTQAGRAQAAAPPPQRLTVASVRPVPGNCR